jgi:predicted DNA repair protein MutK
MFSLLSLLDDIATTLDDVAVMTKVAIKKASALMSDDLAVNAGVVHGAQPDRELPIVKAIFWGSLLNKVYCIVGVLALSTFYPPILTVILVIGGIYLSYEGAHKVYEKLFTKKSVDTESAPVEKDEQQRIKGAVRTDLILSIEIIVIAKNAMKGELLEQTLSLILVGLAASVLIYGLVAILVKIDDLGLHLVKKGYRKVGMALISSMPYVMKGLGILGTTAMFLVGGGILVHTFHIPLITVEMLQNLVVGVMAGFVALPIISLASKLKKN